MAERETFYDLSAVNLKYEQIKTIPEISMETKVNFDESFWARNSSSLLNL